MGSATKPSFLLWDKVYQKISSVDEEMWLFCALCETFEKLKEELKSEQTQLGVLLMRY